MVKREVADIEGVRPSSDRILCMAAGIFPIARVPSVESFELSERDYGTDCCISLALLVLSHSDPSYLRAI